MESLFHKEYFLQFSVVPILRYVHLFFLGNVLKIIAPKNLKFNRRIFFRVFEEFCPTYSHRVNFKIKSFLVVLYTGSQYGSILSFCQISRIGVCFLSSGRSFVNPQPYKTMHNLHEHFHQNVIIINYFELCISKNFRKGICGSRYSLIKTLQIVELESIKQKVSVQCYWDALQYGGRHLNYNLWLQLY